VQVPKGDDADASAMDSETDQLRRDLHLSITPDIWEQVRHGFGDPDLADQGEDLHGKPS